MDMTKGLTGMDDTEFYYDQEKFDAVWRRVTNQPETGSKKAVQRKAASADEKARLRAFMDDEANDAQIYGTLAGMVSGCARQTLLQISGDEKGHLKRLRAYYFILTGETYMPPCACPLIYSVCDTLRKKYSGESEGSKAYLEAAASTSNEDLSDTYRALGADEARHRKIIGCLIENML